MSGTLSKPEHEVNSYSERFPEYSSTDETFDPDEVKPKEVLWRNLCALMESAWGKRNLRRLRTEAKVGEASVHRLKPDYVGFPTLDTIQAVARVFRRDAWQLLHPRMDAQPMSPRAAELGAMFDAVPADRQAVAYALTLQLLQFENVGRHGPGSPPSSEQEPEPETPPESAPSSPDPRRKPAKSR